MKKSDSALSILVYIFARIGAVVLSWITFLILATIIILGFIVFTDPEFAPRAEFIFNRMGGICFFTSLGYQVLWYKKLKKWTET